MQLSDPSGTYEAILFQEGQSQFRDLLEKGADVLGDAPGGGRPRGRRTRIVNVERLTDATTKVQKGLKCSCATRPRSIRSSGRRARGDGEVSLVVILGPKDGGVESACPAAMRSAPRSPAR